VQLLILMRRHQEQKETMQQQQGDRSNSRKSSLPHADLMISAVLC
jgi:hypothetical protein